MDDGWSKGGKNRAAWKGIDPDPWTIPAALDRRDAEIDRLRAELREAVKAGNWARAEATNAKGEAAVARVKMFEAEKRTAADTLQDLQATRKAARITGTALAAEMRRRGHKWHASTVSQKESGVRGTWLHELDDWRESLEALKK